MMSAQAETQYRAIRRMRGDVRKQLQEKREFLSR